MSTNDLDRAFDIAPPASPKAGIISWGGRLWSTTTTCENYEVFPSLGMCSGLRKFYALFTERHEETGRLFDNSLFFVFMLVFVAFLISSIYTIFVEEKKIKEFLCLIMRYSHEGFGLPIFGCYSNIGVGYFSPSFLWVLLGNWTITDLSTLKLLRSLKETNHTHSLKEISNKVRKTTDAIVSILRAFWTIKEVKISNLKMEAECKKILRMKFPAYLFDSNRVKNFEGAAFVAFADLNVPVKSTKAEIVYSHEEEFPIESDWISLQGSSSDVLDLVVSEQISNNNVPKVMDEKNSRLPILVKHNEIVKDRRILRKRFESLSSTDVSSKKDFNSTALEAIPEGYSDGEDSPPTRKWISKRNTIPGSGRIVLPSAPEEHQPKHRKWGQHNLKPTASGGSGGIFAERKKILEKVKRSKSLEQTTYSSEWSSPRRVDKSFTNISNAQKVLPKKSGIFNRSKLQPRLEVLSRH